MTQQQVIDIIKGNNPKRFKKSGTYSYRVAETAEKVVTTINGEKETENTANPGDYILTGAGGELYVITPATFAKRYIDNGDGTAEAKGECWGNIYQGEPITFTASWNEEMICNPGDYLVSPNAEFTEAYRIEKEQFTKTYQPA